MSPAILTGSATIASALIAVFGTWLFNRGWRRKTQAITEAEQNRIRAEGIMDRQSKEIAEKDARIDRLTSVIDALLDERGSARAPHS